MRHFILFFTSLSFLTISAFGQKDIPADPIDPGMSNPGMPMPGPSVGNGRVYNFQGDCHFRPEISREDQSLLAGAQSAIEALKNNSACQALAPQFNAFEAAMTNYNRFTGADRAPGYDGNVNVNCVNYDQIYDLSYDFFVSNYSSDNNNLPREYFSCKNQDRTVAIDCAAEVTGRLKSVKQYECELSGAAINEAQRAQIVAESYRTGMTALNAIINNNDCIDATGAQRMSFVQSAVGLAGRAAMIGTGAVGAPLIGLATNLVGSLVNKIFSNQSQNTLSQLENRGNLAELACLYEKLEDKSNRCDRVSASVQNDFSVRSYQNAQACLTGSHRATTEVDRLLREASEIVSGLNRPAPADEGQTQQALTESMFENLVDRLNANFPGSNESVLAIGDRAAEETVAQLQDAMSSDENFRRYYESQNAGGDMSTRAMRRARSEMDEKLAKAQRVKRILAAIKSADSSMQIKSEDLEAVRASMEGSVNFMGDFNEVLRMRMAGSGSLSEQIRLYNSQLSQARTYQSMVNTYSNNEARRNSRFDDNGTFELARNSLRPYLAKMLDNELDTLKNAALQQLSSIQPGPAPTSAQRDQRMTQEETILYPILRACNQLQSVMNQGDRSGIRPTRVNNQHEVCRAVTCGGNTGRGVQSFTDYLQQNNLQVPNSSTCEDQECRANYTRYICQQKKQLPTIRSQLSNEFLEEGKLCGRSLRDALTARR